MNREIKIRFWHKKEKLMSDVFNILELEYYSNFNPDDFVVMQFTGLKDCLGNDIYEGDILKGESDAYIYGDKADVYFREGSFCISYLYDATPIELSYFDTTYKRAIKNKTPKEIKEIYGQFKGQVSELTEFKIIGNIFENKELIE